MKNKLYQCPECKLYYPKEILAKKCGKFCKKNKSCSLDIIKYAVKKNK